LPLGEVMIKELLKKNEKTKLETSHGETAAQTLPRGPGTKSQNKGRLVGGVGVCSVGVGPDGIRVCISNEFRTKTTLWGP